jgi:hypothetical protein
MNRTHLDVTVIHIREGNPWVRFHVAPKSYVKGENQEERQGQSDNVNAYCFNPGWSMEHVHAISFSRLFSTGHFVFIRA